MLLDDLVLDVGKYANFHPGGAFLINHNIGRDVSKFFYGGYSLEDEGKSGFEHTNFARKIVNRLAIAIIETPAEIELYKINHLKTVKINNDIRTFTFQAKSKKVRGI